MLWTGARARGEREMCRTDQPGERQGKVSAMAAAQAPPPKLHQSLPHHLSLGSRRLWEKSRDSQPSHKLEATPLRALGFESQPPYLTPQMCTYY